MPVFNSSFFEAGCDIIPLINGSDANGVALTGDWLKLRDYNRVGILLAKFGSEDVDSTNLQFLQGQDASGTGSKALLLPANRPIWYKTGTLTAQNTWTKTSFTTDTDGLGFGATLPGVAARVLADVNTAALLLYTELLASDLDIANQFDWMTAYIGNNVDNACIVSVFAILQGGSYSGVTPQSAIS